MMGKSKRVLIAALAAAIVCIALGGRQLVYAVDLHDVYETVSGDELDFSTRPLDTISANDLDFLQPNVFQFDYIDETGTPRTDYYFREYDPETGQLHIVKQSSDEMALMSSYSVYQGLLSTTYIEMFRGLAAKLPYSHSYVAARVGQYDYIFASAEDLHLSGTTFIASDATVVTYNTQYNGTYSVSQQSSFSLSAGQYLVYSNIGKTYPSLESSEAVYTKYLFLLVGCVVIGYIINCFFIKGSQSRERKQAKRGKIY